MFVVECMCVAGQVGWHGEGSYILNYSYVHLVLDWSTGIEHLSTGMKYWSTQILVLEWNTVEAYYARLLLCHSQSQT